MLLGHTPDAYTRVANVAADGAFSISTAVKYKILALEALIVATRRPPLGGRIFANVVGKMYPGIASRPSPAAHDIKADAVTSLLVPAIVESVSTPKFKVDNAVRVISPSYELVGRDEKMYVNAAVVFTHTAVAPGNSASYDPSSYRSGEVGTPSEYESPTTLEYDVSPHNPCVVR